MVAKLGRKRAGGPTIYCRGLNHQPDLARLQLAADDRLGDFGRFRGIGVLLAAAHDDGFQESIGYDAEGVPARKRGA